MKDVGREQIVQVVKVIAEERLSARTVEQIGVKISQQIEEEKENVVQVFPQERGHHCNVELTDDFLVQWLIPQKCVLQQRVQDKKVMPQERLLERQVAEEIREVNMDIETARETQELLKTPA